MRKFIAVISLVLFTAACAGVVQDCPVTPMGGAECIGGPAAPTPAKASTHLGGS